MYAVEFNHIWKKYRKGEKFYALRDRIPDLIKRLLRGKSRVNRQAEVFWAVKDVSFKLEKGESLGIMGPNGAGKSTILKLLSEITFPSRGDFKINGRLSSLIEVGAGFHPEFTGRDNVYFSGAVLGMKKKEIDAKFDEIVDFSGVEDFIDTPVKRYSTGMAGRLGFAIAAHVDPDILIVDEVLAVGDMQFQAKCIEKMKQLFQSGATIILVTHNSTFIQAICQRVILLDKGEIIKEGACEEVLPFYENLVNQRREEELKKEIERTYDKQKIKDNVSVKIHNIELLNKKGELKESFGVDEPLSVRIDYETQGEVDNPVVTFEIFRSDKILCCYCDMRNENFQLGKIEGRGSIIMHIDKTTLGPGIYFTKVTFKDKDMVHSYVIAQKAVFKIETKELRSYCNSVFRLNVSWENKSR